jgi:hypothetical protein
MECTTPPLPSWADRLTFNGLSAPGIAQPSIEVTDHPEPVLRAVQFLQVLPGRRELRLQEFQLALCPGPRGGGSGLRGQVQDPGGGDDVRDRSGDAGVPAGNSDSPGPGMPRQDGPTRYTLPV